MARTTTALLDLGRVLDAPHDDPGSWRTTVRRQLGSVRELLATEPVVRSARAVRATRERDSLLGRIDRLGRLLLSCSDVDAVCAQLSRLRSDIARHDQRLRGVPDDDAEPARSLA